MVKSIFSILTVRQTSILSSAVVMMATFTLSKILGLIRDRLLASNFDPETVAIFIAATRIPDLIFQLLIFGALSVAFIPVFTDYLEKKNREEAFVMASSILNLSLIVLTLISIIIFIFVKPLTELIVPGFSADQQVQVASLTRVILVGQIILTIGSFFIGILQSFQRFIVPALAGVFYNLGIILGIVIFGNQFGILSAAIGVFIGSALHVFIQLPLILKLGFNWRFSSNLFLPGVREITRLMSIRTIGLAAEQVNETAGVILASIISTASVTYLTFAQHLQVVPISIFGATLAQAALPILSSERSRGRMEEFKVTLLTTLHQILFLALPAIAVLIVLRIPAVRLVFGASEFNWEATVLTGKTLALLSIGLAAQAVSLLLVRGFYALKDTKTPVIVSLIVVSINIMLSLYFVKFLNLEVWSLGLAFSLSSIISGILLFFTLHLKVGGFNLNQVLGPLIKMIMATIIMGMALYIPVKLLDQVIFDTTRTVNLIILTGIASLFALFVYVLLVWYMEVKELATYANLAKNIFKKMSKWPERIKSEEIIHETDTV